MTTPNRIKTLLALSMMITTLGVHSSLAQATPRIPTTPPAQPTPDGSGNPGGGNIDPCGDVPCAVAVH